MIGLGVRARNVLRFVRYGRKNIPSMWIEYQLLDSLILMISEGSGESTLSLTQLSFKIRKIANFPIFFHLMRAAKSQARLCIGINSAEASLLSISTNT